MPISIRKVAAHAGVSASTVSRVLSDHPDAQIAPETRERVHEAVRDLNYRPKPAGKKRIESDSTARGRIVPGNRRIGIVLTPNEFPLRHAFFGAQFDGILQAATKRRLTVSVFAGPVSSEPDQVIEEVRQGHCDGVLVLYHPPDKDVSGRFLEADVPFVVLNETRNDPRICCVDVDNVNSARQMTRYLLDLGHRRIALLGHFVDELFIAPRIQGYRQALAERAVACDESLIVTGLKPWYVEEIRQHIVSFLERPIGERPTAIFCANDEMAVTVVAVLNRLNLQVPRDMSVAGFNDDAAAERVHPSLTTMRQPYERIAGDSFDLLLKHLSGIPLNGKKILLPTELVVRESTGPPLR